MGAQHHNSTALVTNHMLLNSHRLHEYWIQLNVQVTYEAWVKEPAIELYFSLEKIEKNKDNKYVGSCITHCFSDQVIHKNMKVSQIQVLDSMKQNKTRGKK